MTRSDAPAGRILGFVSVLSVFLFVGFSPGLLAQDTPEEIVRQVDELLRGESSQGRVSMEVVTERWTRRMEMEMWSLGQDYSLVRVLSPAREAGTATLMAQGDIWNWGAEERVGGEVGSSRQGPCMALPHRTVSKEHSFPWR